MVYISDRNRQKGIVDFGLPAPAHTGDPIYHNDELIGVVTRGAFGHYMGVNIAMGDVDPQWSAPDTELAVEVIGQRCRSIVRRESMFDPAHERPRAGV